jgi:hypothetical protein
MVLVVALIIISEQPPSQVVHAVCLGITFINTNYSAQKATRLCLFMQTVEMNIWGKDLCNGRVRTGIALEIMVVHSVGSGIKPRA